MVNQCFQSTLDSAFVTCDVEGSEEKGISEVMVEDKALPAGGCLIMLLEEEEEEEDDLDVKKENGLMLALDTVI